MQRHPGPRQQKPYKIIILIFPEHDEVINVRRQGTEAPSTTLLKIKQLKTS